MPTVHSKIARLIPLIVLGLILVGCARSRPESEQPPTPISPGTQPDVGESLPSTETEGPPTTVAIVPTATPTLVGDGGAGSGGEGSAVQATATPLPTPIPTATPVPALPPPNTGSPGTGCIHIVQPGENLFRISLQYNTSIDAIAQANGITNQHLIYVGQRLVIPGQGGACYPPPGGGTPGNIHIVQPGDTLSSIALRYNTTVQALMTANSLTSPNLIYIGQRLIVP